MSGKYPDTYYRVSVKALIRNNLGEVLVVKEKADFWNLPGGGINHGETLHDCLVRELFEEVLIDVPFTESIVATESIYLETKEAWLLWLVCEIMLPEKFHYGIGTDASEVTFIDPKVLENSERLEGRLIYKIANKATS